MLNQEKQKFYLLRCILITMWSLVGGSHCCKQEMSLNLFSFDRNSLRWVPLLSDFNTKKMRHNKLNSPPLAVELLNGSYTIT